MKTDKITRVLYLYSLLRDGKKIDKTIFSMDHNVSERGFDRDIQDIRLMLSDMGIFDEVIYDKTDNTYYMTGQDYHTMDDTEALIFGKLLLNSNSLRKDESEQLLSTLISVTDKHKRKILSQMLTPDMKLYNDKKHKKAIVKLVNDLGYCIMTEKRITLRIEEEYYNVIPLNIIFEKSGFVLKTKDEHNAMKDFIVDRIDDFKVI